MEGNSSTELSPRRTGIVCERVKLAVRALTYLKLIGCARADLNQSQMTRTNKRLCMRVSRVSRVRYSHTFGQ